MSPEQTIAFQCVLLFLSLFFCALRSYARYRYPPKTLNRAAVYIGEISLWMAWLVGLAFVYTEVYKNLRIMALRKTHGQNPEMVSVKLVNVAYKKVNFSLGFIYPLFIWLVKSSFICLYFESYTHLTRRVKVGLLLTTAYTVITFLVICTMKLFWCGKISNNWAPSSDPGHQCNVVISLPLSITGTVLNITSDLCIFLLFIAIIRTLHFRKPDMYAITFLGVISVCTIVASTFRFAFIYRLVQESNNSGRNLEQFLVWTTLQGRLMLFAACLPALRVLVRGEKERHEARNSIDSIGKPRYIGVGSDPSLSEYSFYGSTMDEWHDDGVPLDEEQLWVEVHLPSRGRASFDA